MMTKTWDKRWVVLNKHYYIYTETDNKLLDTGIKG
jgi:hypothetical protein